MKHSRLFLSILSVVFVLALVFSSAGDAFSLKAYGAGTSAMICGGYFQAQEGSADPAEPSGTEAASASAGASEDSLEDSEEGSPKEKALASVIYAVMLVCILSLIKKRRQ